MADPSIRSYRDLLIWQRAMDVATACYVLCRKLPEDERYGLASQLKRSAVSIAANIAEGHGRELPGSFIQHLRIGQGSLKELETLLQLLQRIELLDHGPLSELLSQCDELGRMMRAMIRSIQEKT